MAGEKERILKMLEDGTINSKEAYKLLESIEKTGGKGAGRLLRIMVKKEGEDKVNVKIPLNIAKKFLSLGGKLAMRFSKEARDELEKYDIDLEEIMRIIDEGLKETPMTLVEVDEENESVKVWIE